MWKSFIFKFSSCNVSRAIRRSGRSVAQALACFKFYLEARVHTAPPHCNAVQTMASDIPLGRVGSTSKSTNSRHSISVHRLPSPAPSDEDVGPKPRSLRDVEGSIPKSLPDDPFLLRDALKTETELNELKHRKPNGKAVAAYQRKQNEVRAAAYSATP